LLRGEDAWTASELVHALVILATVHALAGLVFGLGLNLELDLQYFSVQQQHLQQLQQQQQQQQQHHSLQDGDDGGEVAPGSSPTERALSGETFQLVAALKGVQQDDMEASAEEQAQEFKKVGEDGITTADNVLDADSECFQKYLGTWRIPHSDFDVCSAEYSALRMQV
jgi:hypothetical protein